MVVTHTHHNTRVTISSSNPDRHPPYVNAQAHTTTQRVGPAGPESGDVCWKIARRRVLCVLCTVCVRASLACYARSFQERERKRGLFMLPCLCAMLRDMLANTKLRCYSLPSSRVSACVCVWLCRSLCWWLFYVQILERTLAHTFNHTNTHAIVEGT